MTDQFMTPYKNISGDSGVLAYEIAKRSIKIKFKDGDAYIYDYTNPGAEAVEIMKKLAIRGQGLASYINANVRKNYARKVA